MSLIEKAYQAFQVRANEMGNVWPEEFDDCPMWFQLAFRAACDQVVGPIESSGA